MIVSRLDDGSNEGKKAAAGNGGRPQAAAGAGRPPDMIPMNDQYGETVFLNREQWKNEVLLKNLKVVWDDPDALFNLLVRALSLGFMENVLEAGKHLYEIDNNPIRGAILWGSMLTQADLLDEADAVYRRVTDKCGERAEIQIKWAVVYLKRGKNEEVAKMVQRALELDPNLDEAVAWYDAAHQSLSPEIWKQEMLRVASLDGSWRVKLSLAAMAIREKNLDQALVLYEDVICDAPKPIPADVLGRISLDLGRGGYPKEMIDVCGPLFDPIQHGAEVGHNIIMGYLNLENFDAATDILNKLFQLGRPDWQNGLDQLDQVIFSARAQDHFNKLGPQERKIALGLLNEPIWLREGTPAHALFPEKVAGGPIVLFSGNSLRLTELDVTQGKGQQITRIAGQLSRGFSMLLAEQIHLQTNGVGMVVTASVISGGWGFGLLDEPLKPGKIIQPTPDFEVTLHVTGKTEPEMLEVTIHRTKDQELLASIQVPFQFSDPEAGFRDLLKQVRAVLEKEEAVKSTETPRLYTLNDGQWIQYAVHLEELLGISANIIAGNTKALFNERRMIRGQMRYSLINSTCVNARLLLVQTLLQLKRARPDIVAEFKDRVNLLHKNNPLGEKVNSSIQGLLDEVFV